MQQRSAETATPPAAVPVNEFETLTEIIARARAKLHQNEWDYIVGGSDSETTLKRNRMALDSIAFRPRVLRDVSKIDMSVEQFGRRLRLPLLLAPVGSLQSFHPEAGAEVVRAARAFGIAHMISSACQPGLEGLAQAAPDALRIFQLYVRGDEAWTDSHVERAIKAGYAAFCLTVDSAIYSRRERDLIKRYVTQGRRAATGPAFQAGLDWKTIARIKKKFQIPLVIKGIATAEDTRIAVDHGVEWVYVSNHGGRQLDHGRGAIDVLPEVVEAAAGRAKVMIDGAFNRGSDIVKAIVLGADLVGLGRMQCYGLAANGQAGIVRVLEILEDEIRRTLGLLGVTRFAELEKSCLTAATPVAPPHLFSAFPLLKIADYDY